MTYTALAKTLYPDDGEEYSRWFYDYTPIVEHFGDVLLRIDDNGWQGDSRLLYRKDGKIGHLIFGWGSCSGCDALQACSSYDAVGKLIEELENDVRWFDNAKDALEWFETYDWEANCFSYHDGLTREYIEKSKNLLRTME